MLLEYLEYKLNKNNYILKEVHIQFLNNGVQRFLGRDHQFRPIFVQDFKKLNLEDDKEMDLQFESCIRILNYVIDKMLLPG